MDSGGSYGHLDPSGDVALARLAATQHGVVATRQLKEWGFSMRSIRRRVDKARLHRLHRGVYAVGHIKISLKGRWMAAVLACGPEAVLSHHSAAALWELRNAPGGKIDVTAPGRRRIAGIRCHTARTLDPRDRTTIDGIPVTSCNRTLLDLAELLSPQRLRSTLEAVQRRDLLDVKALRALLARSPGRRGVTRLRAALAQLHDEAPFIQSELERRFLELIRAAGLPEPQCNVVVAGELVDFYWPAHRLVVEVDGYRFHKTRRSFEEDRRRDARLQIAEIRVVRVTHERITREADALLADLRRLLRLGSPPA